jgi:hypothetical protein
MNENGDVPPTPDKQPHCRRATGPAAPHGPYRLSAVTRLTECIALVRQFKIVRESTDLGTDLVVRSTQPTGQLGAVVGRARRRLGGR